MVGLSKKGDLKRLLMILIVMGLLLSIFQNLRPEVLEQQVADFRTGSDDAGSRILEIDDQLKKLEDR